MKYFKNTRPENDDTITSKDHYAVHKTHNYSDTHLNIQERLGFHISQFFYIPILQSIKRIILVLT